MEESRLSTVDLLDQLEEIFLEGSRIPFSGNRLVNEQEAIEILDEIREAMPNEIIKASEIIRNGDKYINQSKVYAEEIITKAKHQRNKLVDSVGVKQEAERQIVQLQQHSQQKCEKLLQAANQKAIHIEQETKIKIAKLEKLYSSKKEMLEQDILNRKRQIEVEEQRLMENLKRRIENNNKKAIEQLEQIKQQSITLQNESIKRCDRINSESQNFKDQTQQQCEALIIKAKKEAKIYQDGANNYAEETLKELERRLNEINLVVMAGRTELSKIQAAPSRNTAKDRSDLRNRALNIKDLDKGQMKIL